MATNSISTTTYRTALAEAADAIDSRDYDTAELKILKASTILAGLELEKGSQQSVIKWRADLNQLRELLDKVRTQSNSNEKRFIRGRINFR